MTRSDWQLAEDEHVIYVVGPYPVACSRSYVTLEVIAEVDTIAVGTIRQPRQYLAIPK
jgi:hypothetical protein